MKLSARLGINPEAWKDKTFEDFGKLCKGYLSPSEIKEVWGQIKKKFPKPKKVVKPKEEGAE
jgi:hypothetical protein